MCEKKIAKEMLNGQETFHPEIEQRFLKNKLE